MAGNRAAALYQCVDRHLETFAAVYEERFAPTYGPWRPIVRTTADAYLDCGRYESGFARLHCDACGTERLLADLARAAARAITEVVRVSTGELVRPSREAEVGFGFNEWLRAQDGSPQGQDWQTWSAGMYLYAAACVEEGRTPFFDEVRSR